VPESKLVLGKHSGRHALKKRTEELGYDLRKEELQSLYDRFTSLADNKKGLLDEEIAALIEEGRIEEGAMAMKVAAD
jgi:2-isopropylmalate synthase